MRKSLIALLALPVLLCGCSGLDFYSRNFVQDDPAVSFEVTSNLAAPDAAGLACGTLTVTPGAGIQLTRITEYVPDPTAPNWKISTEYQGWRPVDGKNAAPWVFDLCVQPSQPYHTKIAVQDSQGRWNSKDPTVSAP